MAKTEIAEAVCPSCSPDEATTHIIVKHPGLIKCEQCGYVHAVHVPKKKVLQLRVIVSRQDKSSQQMLELSEDDEVSVGDEFVVEHGDEVSGIRVQSIEVKTKGRPERAIAKDIDTLWARTIDEAIVKIAIQRGALTESVNYKVGGDFEFTVGGTIRLKGYDVSIVSIKQREGDHYKRPGQIVKAKDVRRIYARQLDERRPRRASGGFRPRQRKA